MGLAPSGVSVITDTFHSQLGLQQNHQWREEQRQGNLKTAKPGAWLNVPTSAASKPDHNQRGVGRKRGRKVPFFFHSVFNLTFPKQVLFCFLFDVFN